MTDSELQLLALCTRFESSPSICNQIKTVAARITCWDTLPALAEEHGLAPLVYFHLKRIPDAVPAHTLRTLNGQALRDRLINQVRTSEIAAIAASFEQADTPLLFLKGAALAHLLYPEPGLRPMSDLDILVDKGNLDQACLLLSNLGYQGASYLKSNIKSRHLPLLSREAAGFFIGIELHFALFQHPDGRPWFEMSDLSSPPLPFQVTSSVQALSLGREDMLFHLCQHAFYNNSGFDSLRLMWVADIVNYANRFCKEIDWAKVRRLYPSILHTLVLLHPLSPLSEDLILFAGLNLCPAPAGPGHDFKGWPVLPVSDWRRAGYHRVLMDTLFPSPWWLQLHYGASRKAPLWYHWGRHVSNLLGESLRRTRVHRGDWD